MNVKIREVEAKGVTTAIVIEFPEGLTGYSRETAVAAFERLMAEAGGVGDIEDLIEDAHALRRWGE